MDEESIKKKIEIQKQSELAHIKKGRRSTVCLSVGLGKSKLAINRIFSYNKNSKILFVGAREIYSENFKKELEKFNCTGYDITFICTSSLKKFDEQYWDFVIFDEVHKHTEQVVKSIPEIIKANNNVELLCLTGTPTKESALYLFCPISYIKVIDDAVEEKMLNDYKISIIYHNITHKERAYYNYMYNRWIDWKKNNTNFNVYPQEMRMLKNVLKGMKSKENACLYLLNKYLKNYKTLIYAGTIKQSKQMGLEMFHSQMTEDKKWDNYNAFCEGKINWLVNVNSIKEAVSIPNLTHSIIMAPDASWQSMEQMVGRTLRLMTDEIGTIIILCAKRTIEEEWVKKAVSGLDMTKIKYLDINNL